MVVFVRSLASRLFPGGFASETPMSKGFAYCDSSNLKYFSPNKTNNHLIPG